MEPDYKKIGKRIARRRKELGPVSYTHLNSLEALQRANEVEQFIIQF